MGCLLLFGRGTCKDRRVSGRVALVTGGGGGIGAAIAGALASDGHAVAVADLRLAAAEEAADRIAGRALPVEIDVTDGGAVAEAVSRVERELGPVDVVVNNAGWDELKPFVDTDEEFWDRVI